MLEVVHELGEFLELAPAPPLGDATEPRHARRHVGLEADPLLLAVVADVDAGRLLLGHHMTHGLVHLGVEHRLVVGFARLAFEQQIGQRLIARQAADVGGEDAIEAVLHGSNRGSARGWAQLSAGECRLYRL